MVAVREVRAEDFRALGTLSALERLEMGPRRQL